MIWFCLTVVYVFSLTVMMGNFAVNGIWVPDEDANLVFFLSVAPITNTLNKIAQFLGWARFHKLSC